MQVVARPPAAGRASRPRWRPAGRRRATPVCRVDVMCSNFRHGPRAPQRVRSGLDRACWWPSAASRTPSRVGSHPYGGLGRTSAGGGGVRRGAVRCMVQDEGAGSLRAALTLRAELLGPARTRALTGERLVRAGRVLHSRPERLSEYGVPTPEMTGRGLRLLGRTVVECSVDDSCAASPGRSPSTWPACPRLTPGFVADLFCGSGNIGWHVGTGLGLPVFAAERDPDVGRTLSHAFSRAGAVRGPRSRTARTCVSGWCSPRGASTSPPDPAEGCTCALRDRASKPAPRSGCLPGSAATWSASPT